MWQTRVSFFVCLFLGGKVNKSVINGVAPLALASIVSLRSDLMSSSIDLMNSDRVSAVRVVGLSFNTTGFCSFYRGPSVADKNHIPIRYLMWVFFFLFRIVFLLVFWYL